MTWNKTLEELPERVFTYHSADGWIYWRTLRAAIVDMLENDIVGDILWSDTLAVVATINYPTTSRVTIYSELDFNEMFHEQNLASLG